MWTNINTLLTHLCLPLGRQATQTVVTEKEGAGNAWVYLQKWPSQTSETREAPQPHLCRIHTPCQPAGWGSMIGAQKGRDTPWLAVVATTTITATSKQLSKRFLFPVPGRTGGARFKSWEPQAREKVSVRKSIWVTPYGILITTLFFITSNLPGDPDLVKVVFTHFPLILRLKQGGKTLMCCGERNWSINSTLEGLILGPCGILDNFGPLLFFPIWSLV